MSYFWLSLSDHRLGCPDEQRATVSFLPAWKNDNNWKFNVVALKKNILNNSPFIDEGKVELGAQGGGDCPPLQGQC